VAQQLHGACLAWRQPEIRTAKCRRHDRWALSSGEQQLSDDGATLRDDGATLGARRIRLADDLGPVHMVTSPTFGIVVPEIVPRGERFRVGAGGRAAQPAAGRLSRRPGGSAGAMTARLRVRGRAAPGIANAGAPTPAFAVPQTRVGRADPGRDVDA